MTRCENHAQIAHISLSDGSARKKEILPSLVDWLVVNAVTNKLWAEGKN